MVEDPHFYMQIISNPDNEPIRDLETFFSGMKYLYCKGLSAKGKIRAYTETYAEKNGVRLYLPPTPTVDTVDIEFAFLFLGDNRRETFDSFYEYVKGKRVRYWDNVRNRQVEMYLSDKVDPSDDYLLGEQPYIQAVFKFTNINGLSTPKS